MTYPINATPEPPNCPACGQPVHVEWADVSRIGDRIPRVIQGNTYCLTPGCKAEWSCGDEECPGNHPSPGGVCWPKLALLDPPVVGLTAEDHRWLRRQQETGDLLADLLRATKALDEMGGYGP
jgi:hypothetical protein